jgi:hypothetical protein
VLFGDTSFYVVRTFFFHDKSHRDTPRTLHAIAKKKNESLHDTKRAQGCLEGLFVLRVCLSSIAPFQEMGMSSKNDEVLRRMQVLLDLLAAAATDDNVFLNKETERCRSDLGEELLVKLPEGPQEWDTAVEELTQQLKESLRETPEREEIEEAQRARVTYKPRSTGKRLGRRANAVSNAIPDTPKRPESPKRPLKTVEPPPPVEDKEEELDSRARLERAFSEMSYPKIGPGYSDSISVVSDLSTPTVMNNWDIPEEEHYGPPLQIGIRQPSIGSNQMVPSPPEHDESSLSLEESIQLRPPSQRNVAPRRGAAAQRLQNHQAVLAHLDQAVGSTNNAINRSKQTTRTSLTTPKLTVNDFSSLNYPADEPSEYAAMRKPIHNARRSLLRKSNKYAASVTATSTRMLLHSNAQKKQNKRYGLNMNKRGETTPKELLVVPPPKQEVDVDGVLSTMNCDIDFIFQELSVLDNEPFARDFGDDESNIGSTAKIKYTLGSVARTLRRDSTSPKKQDSSTKQDSLSDAQKDGWGGTIKEEQSSTKSDPLLIDEDGFIVSNNDTNGDFVDPFAPTNLQEDLDPFANTFFPSAKRDTNEK